MNKKQCCFVVTSISASFLKVAASAQCLDYLIEHISFIGTHARDGSW